MSRGGNKSSSTSAIMSIPRLNSFLILTHYTASILLSSNASRSWWVTDGSTLGLWKVLTPSASRNSNRLHSDMSNRKYGRRRTISWVLSGIFDFVMNDRRRNSLLNSCRSGGKCGPCIVLHQGRADQFRTKLSVSGTSTSSGSYCLHRERERQKKWSFAIICMFSNNQ